MATVERFEDLPIWQLSEKVAGRIYDITETGHFKIDYALRDQVRCASISIFSNIAEGFERDGNKEFINFLSIAKGSCGEVRTQIIFANDRKYLETDDYDSIQKDLIFLSQQISNLIKYLKKSEVAGRKFKPEKSCNSAKAH